MWLNRPSPWLPLDHSLLFAPLLSWLSLQSPVNVKTALPQHTSSRTSRTWWWCPKTLIKSQNLPRLVLVARFVTVSSGLGLVGPWGHSPPSLTGQPFYRSQELPLSFHIHSNASKRIQEAQLVHALATFNELTETPTFGTMGFFASLTGALDKASAQT